MQAGLRNPIRRCGCSGCGSSAPQLFPLEAARERFHPRRRYRYAAPPVPRCLAVKLRYPGVLGRCRRDPRPADGQGSDAGVRVADADRPTYRRQDPLRGTVSTGERAKRSGDRSRTGSPGGPEQLRGANAKYNLGESLQQPSASLWLRVNSAVTPSSDPYPDSESSTWLKPTTIQAGDYRREPPASAAVGVSRASLDMSVDRKVPYRRHTF